MKLLLSITLFSYSFSVAQEPQNIEVKSLEYVWQKTTKEIFVKYTAYQQILRRSFINAIQQKWNVSPEINVTTSSLSPFRLEPKFNARLKDADTSKQYIFIQLFDRGTAANSIYVSMLDVKYRLLKGGTVVNEKNVTYRVRRNDPPFGCVAFERYPYHPSQFKLLCDTIASEIVADGRYYEREVWLKGAYSHPPQANDSGAIANKFALSNSRQSVAVSGEGPFSINLDSFNNFETGKRRHGGANTASSLLTFFSNIDTEKKRSTLFVNEHTYIEGSTTYRAFIKYAETKTAERRRVKDEDGMKSVETSDYGAPVKHIEPKAQHLIMRDGDTACVFTINRPYTEYNVEKIWDGNDTSTIESLPAGSRNSKAFEMEILGTVEGNVSFALTSYGNGQIKKVVLNGEHVFSFYTNMSSAGLLEHRSLNSSQLKLFTLLCLLADKYFPYN